MMDYPHEVWRRFTAAGHAGTLGAESVDTGHAGAGDDAEVELDVHIRAGVIHQAAFRARACPVTVAAADWLCERIEDGTPEVAAAVTARDIEAALELAPDKRVCCLLVTDALASALATESVAAVEDE